MLTRATAHTAATGAGAARLANSNHDDFLWLVFVAALMLGGHFAMTQAFVEADLSTVLPVEFVQLLWASGLGFLLFSESPDLWVFVGGGIDLPVAQFMPRLKHSA